MEEEITTAQIPRNLEPGILDGYQTGRFQAMGCPCEILTETTDHSVGAELLNIAAEEAARIEMKYSRYRKCNIVDEINSADGKRLRVDDETAGLLNFAAECYAISGGLFDVTTGPLREVWRFDGSEILVSAGALAEIRSRIGWGKVSWHPPFFRMPRGFQIDFGGIGKEYAADRILRILRTRHTLSTLVNLGGDIAADGSRVWSVGIEDAGEAGQVAGTILLRKGAIATSGGTKRYVKVNGKTYSHILNPKTGWPVDHSPRSVTVAAETCTEAGFWSTLALLQGANAEGFLHEQGLRSWCIR